MIFLVELNYHFQRYIMKNGIFSRKPQKIAYNMPPCFEAVCFAALIGMFRLIYTQILMPKNCAIEQMKSLLFKSC